MVPFDDTFLSSSDLCYSLFQFEPKGAMQLEYPYEVVVGHMQYLPSLTYSVVTEVKVLGQNNTTHMVPARGAIPLAP